MRTASFVVFLALGVAATLDAATVEEAAPRTVTKVVKLLQSMMDKSKKDGATDRDNYAKFKCYCDKNQATTKETLAEAEESIAEETNLLADRRAANEKLSQEVAALRKSMDDNAASRGTATTNRQNEKSAFQTEESDLLTGVDQLERAIQLLSAVGADQTANTAEDHTRFMAASAVAAANAPAGGFIATKKTLKSLDSDMKQALRAASVFLTSAQRKSLTSFIEAPFTGVYSSQSTEIVGILKNMNDTYWSNLANAQLKEATAKAEYETYMDIAWDEMRDMRASWNAKKSEIGVNAGEIATATTDLSTAEGTKEQSENFLSDLINRCNTKAEEYEKRKMLRANEDAAIAQAISILNSDDSFETFGNVDATSTGATSFVQLRASGSDNIVKHKVIKELIKESKSIQSKHLAQLATAMTTNPFTQVLKMIDDMILVIDQEGKDDVTEKQWCKSEQGNGTTNEGLKTTEIGGLSIDIRGYKSDKKTAETNIKGAKANLLTYRTSMDTETATRTAANAQFKVDLANLQEAEKILGKALAVLEKYYDWLHAHNGAHTYVQNDGYDSGGANIERMAGKSVDELKEACSNMPDCAGFNTDGWLKSSIADQSEWYAWTGGSLYVKSFNQDRATAATMFVQVRDGVVPAPAPAGNVASGENDGSAAITGESSTWGSEMEGQRQSGQNVINMLTFIKSETTKEMNFAIKVETSSQSSFETVMNSLQSSINTETTNLATYETNLATALQNLEEAEEDRKNVEAEREAIRAYLAKIEPRCTFIQTYFTLRQKRRKQESRALNNAINELKGTPAFQNAIAEEERVKLGKCAEVCNGSYSTAHATCQACIEGVSVYGYCVQNSDADGCDTALPTGSAASLSR